MWENGFTNFMNFIGSILSSSYFVNGNISKTIKIMEFYEEYPFAINKGKQVDTFI